MSHQWDCYRRSDDQIRNVSPVQHSLQQAYDGNGVAEIEMSESEYDEVAKAPSDLPWFDRAEYDTSNTSGVYIRQEDTAYAVVLTPFYTR